MAFMARALTVAGLVCSAALGATAIDSPFAGAAPTDPATWPLADGNFASQGDPGWVFFKPAGFDGHGCGIAPDGTIGCDIVPARWSDGTPVQEGAPGPPGSYSCEGMRCPLPPSGATEIVAGPQQPASYVQSGTAAFTRDVDVLVSGYRLVNGAAWCYVGNQGTVSCSSGNNGFTISNVAAILK